MRIREVDYVKFPLFFCLRHSTKGQENCEMCTWKGMWDSEVFLVVVAIVAKMGTIKMCQGDKEVEDSDHRVGILMVWNS